MPFFFETFLNKKIFMKIIVDYLGTSFWLFGCNNVLEFFQFKCCFPWVVVFSLLVSLLIYYSWVPHFFISQAIDFMNWSILVLSLNKILKTVWSKAESTSHFCLLITHDMLPAICWWQWDTVDRHWWIVVKKVFFMEV